MLAIIDDVLNAGGELIMWSTFLRFDETPMKLVVVDSRIMKEYRSLFRRTKKAWAEASAFIQRKLADKAPTKLLQTEVRYSLLVRIKNTFHAFRFHPIATLQPLARLTAETFYCALRLTEGRTLVEDLKGRFKHVQRWASTDNFGAIEKEERAYAHAHPEDSFRISV